MNMKWFALLGLLLFLGVAVAPSINADVKQSSILHSSPLFQVRSCKALDFDYRMYDNHFLGENRHTDLLFDERNHTLQNIIDMIQQMDDSTYDLLIKRVLFETSKDIELTYNEQQKFLQTFMAIKQNPQILNTMNIQKNSKLASWDEACTIGSQWFPGCAIMWVIFFIVGFPIWLGICFVALFLSLSFIVTIRNNCFYHPTAECTKGFDDKMCRYK